MFQMVVPSAAEMYINAPIKVGMHKEASRGNLIGTLDKNDTENNLIDECNNDKSVDLTTSEIIGEDISLRNETAKYYRHKDGSYTAASYSTPIHYKDNNGNWRDIDNTLVLSEQKVNMSEPSKYTTKSSCAKVSFPQDLNSGQKISVEKNGYVFSMKVCVTGEFENIKMSTLESSVKVSKAIVNNNVYDSCDMVSAKSENILSVSDKIEKDNLDKMTLKKLQSSIIYPEAFKDSDLEYVVQPDKIKENIIVHKRQDEYKYVFAVNYDGLIPLERENGAIDFVEKNNQENIVFTIESPFMCDSAGEISNKIKIEIEEDKIEIIPDFSWINDADRAFPVTIDPTIVTSTSISDDAYVDNIFHVYNFGNSDVLYVGQAKVGVSRAYIKPNLPKLPKGSAITNSNLVLFQKKYGENASSRKLCAFMVKSSIDSWTEDEITWDNQPLLKELNGSLNNGINIVDYTPVVAEQNYCYQLNITNAVKNWYENNYNNGLMLATDNENASGSITLYSSENSNISYRPSVLIDYVTNLGLEDYWLYETENVGKYSTAYVNPFNGAMTYVNELVNMTGNLMPISLSMIYSNCDQNISKYNGGYGIRATLPFHLNLQKLLYPISSGQTLYNSGYRYQYYDGDGTVHYFVEYGEKIIDEFDETTEIFLEDNYIVIQDKDGNKEYYNTAKKLVKLEDKNGNAQSLIYKGNRIISIIDGSQRHVDISYNSKGCISSITDSVKRQIVFEYDVSNKLTGIIYPGNRKVLFEYNSNNLLNKIISEDGTYIDVQYTNTLDGREKVKCMRKMTETNGFINTDDFIYSETDMDGQASGNTLVKYFSQKTKQYSFDVYGRTTSIRDNDGKTIFSTFGSDTSDRKACNSFNNLIDTTDILPSVNNVLLNGGFEKSGTAWTNLQTAKNGSCEYSSEETKNSFKALKLTLEDSAEAIEVDQNIEMRSLDLYTFSLDVKIVNELDCEKSGGFIFGFTYKIDDTWYNECSEWIKTTNNNWENFSVSLQLPASSDLSDFQVFFELAGSTGTVYVDNAQVLLSGGSASFNYIENSNFFKKSNVESGFNVYGWGRFSTAENQIVTIDGKNCLRLKGEFNSNNGVVQNVKFKGKKGDTIVFGGTASAFAANSNVENKTFCIKVVLIGQNDTSKTITLNFDSSISMLEQTKGMSYTLEEPCKAVKFYFRYDKQINYAYLYDTFFYCINSGERYTYNDVGLVESIQDNEDKTTKYEYNDAYNVSQITAEFGGREQKVSSYAYYDNEGGGNVSTITNSTDGVVSYKYDDHGQVIEETIIGSDEKKLIKTIEYTEDGNYIRKITDINGNETMYTYYTVEDGNDLITTGLVKSVTDPGGKITEYTYDSNTDEMLTVTNKGTKNTDPLLKKSYSYTAGDVTQVSYNDLDYKYTYRDGKVSSILLDDRIIAKYSYDTRGNLDNIYTDGAGVYEPEYDTNGKIIADKWNYFTTAKYFYDPKGNLSQINDELINKSYKFYYTKGDKIRKIRESDGKVSNFDYNSAGDIALLTFSDNNDIIYDAKYLYNERGKIEDIVIKAPEEIWMHYNYDSLERLNSYSNGPIQTSLTYNDDESSGKAGKWITEYVNTNSKGELLNKFGYSYGENGGVTQITSTGQVAYSATREFDVLNRITKETINGQEYKYTYNSSGKLSSVCKKNVGSTDETVENYHYNNSNLSGGISSIGNHTISYSSGGRIDKIDSVSYTWEKASRLKKIQDGNHTYIYTYDSQGKRVEKSIDGVKTQYMYSGDLLMKQVTNNDVIEFIYDSSSNPTGYTWNGSTYYYLKDASNNIVGVANSNGDLCEYYVYDAFGNVINSTNPNSVNPLRYDGSYMDKETGLYYKDKRYYNPTLRIYMNLDWDTVLFNTITSIVDVVEPVAPSIKKLSDTIINEITVDDKTANSFRIGARILAGSIMVETIAFFGVVNSLFLPELKEWLGSDFAQSDIMYNHITPLLNKLASNILPRFGDAGTYDSKTGLRHIWFANMALGAPWAGYFLNFERTKLKNNSRLLQYTNYTTVEGKYMWQSQVGYSWVYDYFFSLGGPIDKVRLPFKHTINNETTYYIIWCWKADYWNLGAGAEIGIYRTKDEYSAENLFYDIDVNLTVHARMRIVYESSILGNIVLNDFHQTNWWITSFSPLIQHPNVDKIKVTIYARITDAKLNDYINPENSIQGSDWNKFSKVEEIDPERFCKSGDVGCLHFDDPNNGFQFKINY